MILADATRAELFKLVHNRSTLFWAFGLTPAVTLVGGIVIETMARLARAPLAQARPIDSLMDGMATAGNPIVQLLLIIGATVLFAGEYRWHTWRTIVPRADRQALILGKFIVFAMAAGASTIACGVAGFLVGIYDAAILHFPIVWPGADANIALALGVGLFASLVQSSAIAAMVALTAVVSRSVLAATAAPFLVLVGTELAATNISILNAHPAAALLPNMAGRALREFAADRLGDPDAVGLHLAAPGALALVFWAVVLMMIALAIFRSQDLAEE
jgi:ABC-2 type transport system permease protein